ncbi:MAG: MFS transporter [Planctomycetes bacterium]|nr:MFS transporter [Planctomycetota bacterium]
MAVLLPMRFSDRLISVFGSPEAELSDARVAGTLRGSRIEGVAYALMVGLAETYFLAAAIYLGASRFEQGLMAALPLCAGSLGPLLVLRLLGSFPQRRRVVAGGAATQVGLLLFLALGNLGGWLDVSMLIAASCLHQVCAQGTGAAWGSWFGDLVPTELRGRYFAARNRGVHAGIFLGLLAGGALLGALEPGGAGGGIPSGPSLGFALLFGLAGLSRALSCVQLLRAHEPRYRGLPAPRAALRFLRTERGAAARTVLLPVAALYFTVYLASPYFTPFMLEELGFSFLEYMLATAAVSALKVFALPFWGRAIDLRGPRAACALAGVLLALVPLPWLWAEGLGWVIFAQAFSGSCWSGFEVSHFAVLLESSYRRTRPYILAASSMLNGLAQITGSLCGALLVERWLHDLRLLFALSVAVRLSTALALARTLAMHARSFPQRGLLLRSPGSRDARDDDARDAREEDARESERAG